VQPEFAASDACLGVGLGALHPGAGEGKDCYRMTRFLGAHSFRPLVGRTGKRLLAVGASLLLVFTSVGAVALADTIGLDGDSGVASGNINYGTDVPCTSRGTVVDGKVTINYSGSAHYLAGESLTVTFSTDAGITATADAAAIPADWGTTTTDYAFNIHTTVATTVTGTGHQVDITVTGSSSGYAAGSGPSGSGRPQFIVNVDSSCGTVVGDQNNPPTVDAGGPYSGPEGSSISINGASASDSDAGDSIASYSWTKVESGFDGGYGCTLTGATTISPSLSCTDDGSVTLTLQVTDTHGATNSDDATVTVGNANPVVTSASLSAGATTCSVNLNAAFTDAGVNDTHTASVAWGDTSSSDGTVTETAQSGSGTVSASHSYATIGSYTATVTVTDDDLGQGSLATSAFLAGYTTGGILQPINPGPPSSIFKWGSTIPVKIQITNCNGTTPTTLALYITIKDISGNTPTLGEIETTSTSAADTGNLMRFSTNLYIYNLYTKSPYFPDPTATYTLTIHYGSSTGPTVASAIIGLRN
jgi:hypothetical protein